MSARRSTIGQALDLLEGGARRDIAMVVAVSCCAAVLSSLMILSLMQFLVVLSDDDALARSDLLARLYALSGARSEFGFLTVLGVATILLVFLSAAIGVLKTFVVASFSANQTRLLRRRLLNQYLHMPYTFHLGRNSADMSATLLTEVERVVMNTLRPAMELVPATLTSLAVIGVLTTISPIVTGASIFVVGLAYGVIYLTIRPRMREIGARRVAANQTLYKAASESLQGIKEIIVLGREGHYLSHFDNASARVEDSLRSLSVLIDIPRLFIQSMVFAAIILFCLVYMSESTLRSADATALIPILGAFAAAGQRLVPEFQKIYRAISMIRFNGASVARLHDELARTPDPATDRAPPIRLVDNLTLDGIGYTYPDAAAPALIDIDLRIEAGEKIGIFGMSGAGKTTLGDLILGLLPPCTGTLSVDGVTIAGAAVRRWQESVGYVAQEIFLVDATLAENIALGVPAAEIDMAQVRACAAMARIDGFVDTLPHRFDTTVGERGVRLSGGQRQRIAIARALYRGVDLLFLDEATSALDTPTELEVLAAIRALPSDITVVMIAHRLTTLDFCDRIVVVDKGRLAGFGTHDELATDCPAFRRLKAS